MFTYLLTTSNSSFVGFGLSLLHLIQILTVSSLLHYPSPSQSSIIVLRLWSFYLLARNSINHSSHTIPLRKTALGSVPSIHIQYNENFSLVLNILLYLPLNIYRMYAHHYRVYNKWLVQIYDQIKNLRVKFYLFIQCMCHPSQCSKFVDSLEPFTLTWEETMVAQRQNI